MFVTWRSASTANRFMNGSWAAGAGINRDQVQRKLTVTVSLGSLTEFPIWSRPRACSRAASLQTQMARRR
jgi:hypothetical protein